MNKRQLKKAWDKIVNPSLPEGTIIERKEIDMREILQATPNRELDAADAAYQRKLKRMRIQK